MQIRILGELKDKAPELASFVTVTTQPIEELRTYLPKDEMLIEYYYHGRDIFAFVLSDSRLYAVKLDSEGLTDDALNTPAVCLLPAIHP